jgi:DNA primase
MIPSQTIDDIRNKADIVAIIGEYVPLKKRGKNYLGLCPFHSEKTPSFTVSQDKQIFHCFGCNEGGNIFAFLMKAESISFAESVEMLGQRLGIQVKNTGTPLSQVGDKDKYYDIMEIAQKFYREMLEGGEGEPARKYLDKRGVTSETSATFGLGYSPDKWDSLMNFLFKKGVSYKGMEKLGLIIERTDKSGYYDRFRGRLMFPISDLRGRVIGYSGRILTANEEAKYVNSPDSPVYNKGYNLYGINLAKDEIKKQRAAVLVEGNVDLISCWQYGIKNVIAPLGTALTQNQAKMIRRFADNVIIAFDQDSAGSLATLRSVEILKDEGLDVHVAAFEGGKDPDESLRVKGADNFRGSLKKAVPWIEYRIINVLSRYNLTEIESRAKAAKEAAAIIGLESDELVRKGYIKLLAEKLGYTFDEVASEVKRLSFYSQKGQDNSLKRTVEKPALKIEKAEQLLIKLALDHKESFGLFKQGISWRDFTGGVTRNIAEFLLSVDIEAHEDLSHYVLENIPDEESKKLLSKIIVSDYPQSNIEQATIGCINTIKAHHLRSKMEQLRGAIAAAEKEGRHDNVSVLHKEFKDLNEAYRSLSV